jgi:hypothetical protein
MDTEGAEEIHLGQLAEKRLLSVYGDSLVNGAYYRWPDDKDVSPKKLVNLVHNQPGIYSCVLGQIMVGASIKSACALLGVSYRTFLSWLRIGAEHLEAEVDTYLSRLLLDIQRASAFAVSSAEQMALKRDPIRWLSRGPGKQFTEGSGLWQEPNQIILDASMDNPLAIEAAEDATDDAFASDIPDDVRDEALKILESTKILSSDEFTRQARDQYRVP